METLSSLLLIIGMLFVFLAALGLVKMPDLYSRMQTATKASTMGVLCVFVSLALFCSTIATVTQSAMVIFFVILTAPISAHMLGRSAYIRGNPLWEGTTIDELEQDKDKMYFE